MTDDTHAANTVRTPFGDWMRDQGKDPNDLTTAYYMPDLRAAYIHGALSAEDENKRLREALQFYGALSNVPIAEIVKAFQEQGSTYESLWAYTERARLALKAEGQR